MDLASRATYRGQVTKIVNNANEFLKLNDGKVIENADAITLDYIEEEISVLVDRLSAANDSLRKANADVRASIKAEDFEKESDTIADYNDKAVATFTRLQMRLNKVRQYQKQLSSTNGSANDNSANLTTHDVTNSPLSKTPAVKLQKLQPKKFSGDYKEWIPFWEQYRTLVHDNPALSKVDKFNYLEVALVGKAASTLAGLTPSEFNYDAAIALLKDEYGNTDKIIDQTMQSLLSMQPIHSKIDFTGLRNLYNSVLASTRSLEAHGISSSNYFVMLKSVLLRCIPNELRVDFHRYYDDVSDDLHKNDAEDDNVSISTKNESSSTIGIGDKQVKCLLKFLKREVESLEKANEAKHLPNRANPLHFTKAKPTKTAVGLFAAEGDDNSCFFCKMHGHSSENCKSSKPMMEKKKMLKEDGRCYRCLRKGHYSKVCKKRFKLLCKNCKGRHATSMCDPQFNEKRSPSYSSNTIATSTPSVTKLTPANQQSINLYATHSHPEDFQQNNKVYLQTAFAFVSSENCTHSLYVRIVIDGGSQMSFVKSSVARQLNLPIVGVNNISIIPFGSKEPRPSMMCNKVRLKLKSQYDNKEVILDMMEVPEICIDVLSTPSRSVDAFKDFLLADVPLDNVQPVIGISILIGADNYWKLATGECRRITADLAAIDTVLGWTLQGRSPVASDYSTMVNFACLTSLHVSACACEDLQQFWRLETLGITNDEKVSTVSIANVNRVGDRFEAFLPWKNNGSMLHDNRIGSLCRMHALVRKLRTNGRLKEYEAAMSEMIKGGVAELAEESNMGDRIYYMPHRPVFREDKDTTKLRIVFNASAHANNQLSLNDHLEVGMNLLPDILNVLLNFRCGKIALTADIEKAFLQILLHSADRDSHRFFWFKQLIGSNETRTDFSVQTYRMTRVTFGVTCSPHLLGCVIHKILDEAYYNHPEVVDILRKGFYVDDLVASVNDEEMAKNILHVAVDIMKSASMHLRKWNTNSVSIRNQLLAESAPPVIQKVLGMCWYVDFDELGVDLTAMETMLSSVGMFGTKRNILRIMSKIYDPFGLLGPWVVRLKILFQSVWRQQLNWDDRLPPEFEQIWIHSCKEIGELKQLVIPRCVFKEVGSTQIHVYADASQSAYGAVAYLRTTDAQGNICVRFLCAKNRIAPIKNDSSDELTLPKLELTAALVAARLLDYLRGNFQIKFCQEFLWTDSKITMFWISGTQKKWKPYVENRVREIRKLTKISSWRHCPGCQNPADLLTRGISASLLLNSEVWLSGPSWLEQEMNWPSVNEDTITSLATFSLLAEEGREDKEPVNVHRTLLDCMKFSNWKHLLRVTAYCFRAVRAFKREHHLNGQNCKDACFLTAREINQAENYWVKEAQQLNFHIEIKSLQQNKGIPLNSKLIMLNPFLDRNDELLRVGGRLHLLPSPTEAHPVILPKMSHITKLIVIDTHERLFHAGVTTVMTNLRDTYWILKCRQLVRSVVKGCTVCRVLQAKRTTQPFAPLPRERIVFSMPFEVTGVDFAGPLYIYESERKKKVYIMLFTCAASRAIHLELTLDLSTESCILAIRRFIARRGVPRVIWSDNATNLKKTSKELLKFNVTNEKFSGFLANHRIHWKFIVERAPWWGGFWERLVGVVKSSLRTAVGRATLTSDQLYTLLTEVEQTVNDRPLTYVSDDPLDLSPLTPAQLLRGPRYISQPKDICEKEHTVEDLRKAWKDRLKFTNCFKRRWYSEYLKQLRLFHSSNPTKSLNLSIGDVVLMEDRLLPKTLGRLGIVENIFPGRDGNVRACEVRLANGSIYRRPVQLLYPLEVNKRNISSGPEDVEN